jgi:tetratricopeptide (TPR) repeat protein
MTGEATGRWSEIERLLDLTLGADPEEIEHILDKECRDDPDLRKQVERYLVAAAGRSPLDGGIGEQAGDLLARVTGPGPPEECTPGEVIGAYRIDRVIGSGGMGTVYLAHRADGQFERHVALKVLDRCRTDDGAHRRFLRERQILAGLRHPNIAALIDGGVTGAGTPYFVLELVEGETITAHCHRRHLSTEERVRLVLQACSAIHHAHRQGVIHRDLKPSNILVAEGPEGEDQVYVLDFGIALARTGVDLTQTGEILGTPGYMAPEQARGERETVDRRCDLFSLGVILYELCSGHRAFPGDTPVEVLSLLLKGEPTAPRRLRPSMSKDLETIIMTCLEWGPERRYESVRALADDLERYLDGRPVVARPIGAPIRLVRRARRYPRITAALSLLAIAAVLAISTAIMARWSAAARARAAQQLGQEVERIDALLRHSHMAPLHDVRAQRALVRQRLQWIEQERRRLGRRAEGPGDYALGRAYLSLGEYREAQEALDRAWRDGYREPEVASARGRVLAALFQQELEHARLIRDQELRAARIRQIEASYREPALAALRAGYDSPYDVPELTESLIALLDGRFPEVFARAEAALARAPWLYEAKLLAGHAARGQAHEARAAGNHDDAMDSFSQARELYGKAAEIGASDPATHLAVCAVACDAMEVLFFESSADVKPWLEVAQESCQRSQEADPDSSEPHVKMSSAYLILARQQLDRGEATLPTLGQALKAGQRALELDPKSTQGHRAVGDVYIYRSDYLQQHGEDPIPDLNAAIASFEKAIKLNPSYVNAYNSLGSAYTVRIRLEIVRGLDPEPSFQAAVDALKTATDLLPDYANAYNNQGIIYRLRGEYQLGVGDDPRPSYKLAVASYRRVIELNPSYSYAYNNLGNVLRDQGEYELSHGIDPRASFDEAFSSFDKASQLNPEWAFPPLNSGLTRGHLGEYLHLIGSDPEPTLQQAVQELESGIELIGGHPLAYAELAKVHLLSAQHAAGRGASPAAALAKVEAAVDHSLAVDPGNGYARELQGRAALLAARHLFENGRSPQAELRRALRALEQALAISAQDAEIHLAMARLQLLRASWLRGNGDDQAADQALATALTWIRNAIDINPDLAEAHAERARILRAEEGTTVDPSRRSQCASQARSALQQALSINPLLRSSYADLLE